MIQNVFFLAWGVLVIAFVGCTADETPQVPQCLSGDENPIGFFVSGDATHSTRGVASTSSSIQFLENNILQGGEDGGTGRYFLPCDTNLKFKVMAQRSLFYGDHFVSHHDVFFFFTSNRNPKE